MRAAFDLKTMNAAIAGTRFAGRVLHCVSVDSTNAVALGAAQGGAEGGVYVADEQTAGRGRGGHGWHSAVGDGLYVSVIVRPRMAIAQALWLSLATGLAAQSAIAAATGLKADIRWPNDLLLRGRKCGGVLVETSSVAAQQGAAASLRYAVIGVGINVNHAGFPVELATLATSLRLESGHEVERELVLAEFLLALEQEIAELEAEVRGGSHGAGLLERFSAASSWVRGKRVRVDEGGGYTGVTDGVDDAGFLRVMDDGGRVRIVLSGGVRPFEGYSED